MGSRQSVQSKPRDAENQAMDTVRLKCLLCQPHFYLESFKDLRTHKKTHHPKDKLYCVLCGFCSKKWKTCVTHMETVHSGQAQLDLSTHFSTKQPNFQFQNISVSDSALDEIDKRHSIDRDSNEALKEICLKEKSSEKKIKRKEKRVHKNVDKQQSIVKDANEMFEEIYLKEKDSEKKSKKKEEKDHGNDDAVCDSILSEILTSENVKQNSCELNRTPIQRKRETESPKNPMKKQVISDTSALDNDCEPVKRLKSKKNDKDFSKKNKEFSCHIQNDNTVCDFILPETFSADNVKQSDCGLNKKLRKRKHETESPKITRKKQVISDTSNDCEPEPDKKLKRRKSDMLSSHIQNDDTACDFVLSADNVKQSDCELNKTLRKRKHETESTKKKALSVYRDKIELSKNISEHPISGTCVLDSEWENDQALKRKKEEKSSLKKKRKRKVLTKPIQNDKVSLSQEVSTELNSHSFSQKTVNDQTPKKKKRREESGQGSNQHNMASLYNKEEKSSPKISKQIIHDISIVNSDSENKPTFKKKKSEKESIKALKKRIKSEKELVKTLKKKKKSKKETKALNKKKTLSVPNDKVTFYPESSKHIIPIDSTIKDVNSKTDQILLKRKSANFNKVLTPEFIEISDSGDTDINQSSEIASSFLKKSKDDKDKVNNEVTFNPEVQKQILSNASTINRNNSGLTPEIASSSSKKSNCVKDKVKDDISYPCDHCDYVATHKVILDIHLRVHGVKRKFKCPYCDYWSIRQFKLKEHIRVHTGERPYACKYCDYAAKDYSQYLSHTRRHTGEKPFKCPHCDKAFNQRSSRNRHVKLKICTELELV